MQSADWSFIPYTLLTVFSFAYCIQVPSIEKCDYVDSYSVECQWKNTNKSVSFRLAYTQGNEPSPKPIHYCRPTTRNTNSDGITVSRCQTKKVIMFVEYTFFLILVCSSLGESPCPNVTKKEFLFTPEEKNVVLRSPPRHLQYEKRNNGTASIKFWWEKPDRNDTHLSFVYRARSPLFKLVYKQWHRNTNSTETNSIWKVWYTGTKSYYTPDFFASNSIYLVKVYATLAENVNDSDITWSLPSNVVRLEIPKQSKFHHSTTTLVTTTNNATTPKSTRWSLAVSLPIILLLLLIIIIIVLFITRKKCHCLPAKIKIPKPVFMIPIENLNLDEGILDVAEGEKDGEAILLTSALLPFQKLQNNESFQTHQNFLDRSVDLFRDSGREIDGRLQRQPLLSQNESVQQENPVENQENNSTESLHLCQQNGILPADSFKTHNNGAERNSWNNKSYSSLLVADNEEQFEHQSQPNTKLHGNFLGSPLHHRTSFSSFSEHNLKQGNSKVLNKSLPFLRSPSVCQLSEMKRCSFENLDTHSSSITSMNYIMEDSMPGRTIIKPCSSMENLAKKKDSLYLHSKVDEEIPVYVKQCCNFGKTFNDNLSMHATLHNTVNLGSRLYPDCSNLVQKKYSRHLIPHFSTNKHKRSNRNWSTDETSSQVMGSEGDEQCSRSSLSDSSVDSGYSPDPRSPL